MANRYWVGGTGTWDTTNTANWSTTSGGASGASVPTASDNAYFDVNSGSGTVSVASGATASTVIMDSATLVVQLTADIQVVSLTITTGTFDLNGFVLAAQIVNNSGSNAKTLAFGSTGKIQITRTASVTYAYDVYNAAQSLDVTGTHVMEYIGNAIAGVTIGFRPQSSLHPTVNPPIMRFTNGAFTMGPVGGFTFKSFDFTGFSGTWDTHGANILGDITLSSTMTVAMLSATPKLVGTSGTQNITSNGCVFNSLLGIEAAGAVVSLTDNFTLGSTRTLTLTSGTLDLNGNVLSTPIFSSSGTGTRAIIFGGGSIDLTGNSATIWNLANVTGFTCSGTPVVNCTYSGSTGTRTFNHGSSAGGSASNAVDFNVTSGTDTFTVSTNSHINNVDMTGWTGAFGNGFYCYGDFTMSSGSTTYGGSGVMTFAGTGTQTITMNGVVWDRPVTFSGATGTYVMADAFSTTAARTVTLANGTLKLKDGVTSTVGAFATSGTTQKFLQSTLAGSQATLSQASGTVSTSYLTIQDIDATGGAIWNAYTTNSNVDGGNNDGWDFSSQLGKYIYTRRKNKRILP